LGGERGGGGGVEEVAPGLGGDRLHLLEQGVELATVGDPFLVKPGVFRREVPANGPAPFLPGELVVGPVELGRIAAAAAVGLTAGHPSLGEAPLADEAHVTDAGLDASVRVLSGAQAFLELVGG
jgi:hypothetical protein